MNHIISLDLETTPTLDNPQEFALQPWRVATGEASISYFGLGDNSNSSVAVPYSKKTECRIREHLTKLSKEKRVWAWNAPFDVSWLIAHGFEEEVKRISWSDAMLLWKWLEPDRQQGYKLEQAAEKFLKDWDGLELYLKLKRQEARDGYNSKNTALYNRLDCVATSLIVERLVAQMPKSMRNQFDIEQNCIIPVAYSWLKGIPLNVKHAESLRPPIEAARRSSVEALGLEWDEEKGNKILNSPKQLRTLLYEDWEWPVQYYTDKGEPSTDKTALTYGSDTDDRALEILKYRSAKTAFDKFVNGPINAAEYNGEPIAHSAPFIYSTYTGRMTYSSKQQKKYQVGIALHQWKRDKIYRRIITAPKGKHMVEYDFSGQEARLMADRSGDANMINVFKLDKDFHSTTGAALARWTYDHFMKLKAENDETVTGPRGLRYQGKFVNLSLQYRTGAKTLRRKARIDYDMDVELSTAYLWRETYLDLYPGVADYWESAVEKAYAAGYAETMGGRRIYIPRWKFETNENDGLTKWGAESRAINFPIQGTGADMKELAIAIMWKLFPDFEFAFDLHDGLFYWVDDDMPNERVLEAKAVLSNLPYKQVWGWTPAVPLPVDAQRGPHWGELKEVK